MKIAIVDDEHFEVVLTLIRLYASDAHTITVFTDAKTFRQLQYSFKNPLRGLSFELRNKNESRRQFIKRVFVNLRNLRPELVLLSTVSDNHLLYALGLRTLANYRMILTVHDINGYVKPKPFLGFKKVVRFIGKKLLWKMATAYHVLSKGLAGYLSAAIKDHKPVYYIPGSLWDPHSHVNIQFKVGEPICIAVPGSVDSRRRDYHQVFELLDLAALKGLDMEIRLLGGFNPEYSVEIQERIRDYKKNNNNLVCYDNETVDQDVFDEAVSKSHFIWMPLKEQTILRDGITEYYGSTICSGNIGDVIKYAKPFFAPKNLPLDAPLSTAVIPYSTINEIADFLSSLSEEKYTGLARYSLNVSEQFTAEAVRMVNPELFGFTSSMPG